MKIQKITVDAIVFDNGSEITFDHEQECCEHNYADFQQLDDICVETEFDEQLDFEAVENSGFRFGNMPSKMFFVPCYSDQNGCYTTEINIYYDGEQVLSFAAYERE